MLRDWIRRNVVEKGNKVEETPYTSKRKALKAKQAITEQQTIELNQLEMKNNTKIALFKINEDIPDLIVFQNNARDNFFKLAAERKAIREGLWA